MEIPWQDDSGAVAIRHRWISRDGSRSTKKIITWLCRLPGSSVRPHPSSKGYPAVGLETPELIVTRASMIIIPTPNDRRREANRCQDARDFNRTQCCATSLARKMYKKFTARSKFQGLTADIGTGTGEHLRGELHGELSPNKKRGRKFRFGFNVKLDFATRSVDRPRTF